MAIVLADNEVIIFIPIVTAISSKFSMLILAVNFDKTMWRSVSSDGDVDGRGSRVIQEYSSKYS